MSSRFIRTDDFWRLCLPLVCCFAASLDSHAAPVTYRFGGTVASAFVLTNGAPLALDITRGDVITGTFTFEPGTSGARYPQIGGLSLAVRDHIIETGDYVIEVADEDVPNAAPVPGRIADPLNTPIVDQAPGSSDGIYVTCDNFDEYCARIEGMDGILARPLIALVSDSEILTSEDLLDDLQIWNSFTFRELSLEFRDSTTGAETYVGAHLGAVSLVPEPSGASLVLVAAISLAFAIRLFKVRFASLLFRGSTGA